MKIIIKQYNNFIFILPRKSTIRMLKNNLILIRDGIDKSFIFFSNTRFDEVKYQYYFFGKNFYCKKHRMFYKYKTNWIYRESLWYSNLEKFYENI
jgi:hypothetical protein